MNQTNFHKWQISFFRIQFNPYLIIEKIFIVLKKRHTPLIFEYGSVMLQIIPRDHANYISKNRFYVLLILRYTLNFEEESSNWVLLYLTEALF